MRPSPAIRSASAAIDLRACSISTGFALPALSSDSIMRRVRWLMDDSTEFAQLLAGVAQRERQDIGG